MRWSALLIVGVACAQAPVVTPAPHQAGTYDMAEANGTAEARLVGREGNEVGRATLEQTPQGVLITLEITGLPPGERAFHLHEKGACEPPDFTSAGGHFNPGGRHHGLRHPEGTHAGDLPNLFIPETGRLSIQVLAPRATLRGPNALLDEDGAALVIHEGVDDYESQPTGDAGGRVACGVIVPGAK